jgi:hypothetical protein
MLRQSARLLEFEGVTDPELARVARIVLRLASRLRTDRQAAA